MVRTMQVITNLRRYDITCAQSLKLYKQAKRVRRGERKLRREENGRESSSDLGKRLRVTSSPVPPLLAQFCSFVRFMGHPHDNTFFRDYKNSGSEDSNKEGLSMKRYQQAYPISDFSGLGSLQINKQELVARRLEKQLC